MNKIITAVSWGLGIATFFTGMVFEMLFAQRMIEMPFSNFWMPLLGAFLMAISFAAAMYLPKNTVCQICHPGKKL